MLGALAADRTRLAVLTAQIFDLEQSLSALRLEQAQVQSRLDSYKYPVLKLPTEIVTEIFIHVPPPYPGGAWLAGTPSPTSLAQVCREWRQIALSIPALWIAINLSNNRTPVEQRAYLCDLWLQWSRYRPLSIEYDALQDRAVGLSTMKVMALVASILARVEHLKLGVSLDECSAIEGSSMPLLHHLDLNATTHSGFTTPVSFGERELPLLRSVVLNRIATMHARLPWARLTSLVVSRVYLHECVPILSQTSSLIHCELRLHYSFHHGHNDVITLSCLESLVLTCLDGKYCIACPKLLESFITPRLRRLRLPERFLGHEPPRSLTDFISKSGEMLQEVCITNQRAVPRNSYRDAMESIPRVSFSD
ncbi:F-box domain-containing protein [Mycena sanguinolenta]|uniref:F-box domain-containing protein n=1 Tax=Mycena sanguinolenta TaxID=230812 RepID=A0A8H6Y7M8_9AGAR|nr:F-box domain-containing protein [Mycena sanguinolenta]